MSPSEFVGPARRGPNSRCASPQQRGADAAAAYQVPGAAAGRPENRSLRRCTSVDVGGLRLPLIWQESVGCRRDPEAPANQGRRRWERMRERFSCNRAAWPHSDVALTCRRCARSADASRVRAGRKSPRSLQRRCERAAEAPPELGAIRAARIVSSKSELKALPSAKAKIRRSLRTATASNRFLPDLRRRQAGAGIVRQSP